MGLLKYFPQVQVCYSIFQILYKLFISLAITQFSKNYMLATNKIVFNLNFKILIITLEDNFFKNYLQINKKKDKYQGNKLYFNLNYFKNLS